MTLDTDLFRQLTLSSLFVQPPSPPRKLEDPISDILRTLQNLDTTKSYAAFISISSITRQMILQSELEADTIPRVYALWELHLTALIFAHELNLAQQEAKRLSIALDSIVKTPQPKSAKSTPIMSFPDSTPLSLRLLLSRLRANGPTLQALNEAYALLWDLRAKFGKDDTQDKIIHASLTVLSYGVGATLIAKREYGTFLTLADTLDSQKMKFLAVLVSLMKGDYDLASENFSLLDDFSDCVVSLKEVLKSTNPVLDPKLEDTGFEVDLNVTTLDDLIQLIKEQKVTGRIVCALCGMFELQVRDPDVVGEDIMRVPHTEDKVCDGMKEIFKLWRTRTSRLFAFE